MWQVGKRDAASYSSIAQDFGLHLIHANYFNIFPLILYKYVYPRGSLETTFLFCSLACEFSTLPPFHSPLIKRYDPGNHFRKLSWLHPSKKGGLLLDVGVDSLWRNREQVAGCQRPGMGGNGSTGANLSYRIKKPWDVMVTIVNNTLLCIWNLLRE